MIDKLNLNGEYTKLSSNSEGLSPHDYPSHKAGIDVAIADLKRNFNQWTDLLDKTNTRETGNFGRLTNKIKGQLSEIKIQLNDVSRYMQDVYANRNHWPDIDDYEIESRRKFLSDCRQYLQRCRQVMKSPQTREKLERDKRAVEERLLGNNESVIESRSNLVGQYHQQQEMEIKVQDEILDEMTEGLKRLGMIGDTIKVELEEQDQMLEDVDTQIDEAKNRLDALMVKIDKILGHSNKKRIGIIIFLLITLIVLVYFSV